MGLDKAPRNSYSPTSCVLKGEVNIVQSSIKNVNRLFCLLGNISYLIGSRFASSLWEISNLIKFLITREASLVIQSAAGALQLSRNYSFLIFYFVYHFSFVCSGNDWQIDIDVQPYAPSCHYKGVDWDHLWGCCSVSNGARRLLFIFACGSVSLWLLELSGKSCYSILCPFLKSW